MIQISDNFEYLGPKPNFDRDYFTTTEKMKAITPDTMNDGHIAFCSQTGKHYIFNSQGTIDTVLGRWREYLPVDITLVPGSENALGNSAVAKSFSDLQEQFKGLQKQLADIKIDDALDPDSEMPLQNKVLKQEFDSVGTKISQLENELSGYVKYTEVEKTENETSAFPVTSSYLYSKFVEIETQLKALTDKVDLGEPLDTKFDENSNRALENRVINSAILEMQEQVKDLYHEVGGLEYYVPQNYCVSGWSRADQLNPKAVEQWGNPDILRDWQFYLVDHDKGELTEDGTAVIPEAHLQKNNLFRDQRGNYVKTVFTNLHCKGLYFDETYEKTRSAFYRPENYVWFIAGVDGVLESGKDIDEKQPDVVEMYQLPDFEDPGEAPWESLDLALKSVSEQLKEAGLKWKDVDLYADLGDGKFTKLSGVPYPWEEYQRPGQGFSSLKSVVLGNPETIYLLDQVEGKSGLVWKGVFKEPVIWDGIDVSKYELKPTGMGPTPATSVNTGNNTSKPRMFTRFVDYYYYATNGTGLYMGSNSMGHAGSSGEASCKDFLYETHDIDGNTYRRFIYGRSNDVSQLTNCTWARNSNLDPQKPYPFAEGGYHSRNTFVSAMEALYQTKYLNATDFFASGISANDAVTNEAQWRNYGGIRWRKKGSEDPWKYGTWNTTPSDLKINATGSSNHFNALLAYWFPKEQVLESQTAASWAVEMDIEPGEEFEFYGSTWRYENVYDAVKLKDGDMNCIIYKLKPCTIHGYDAGGTPTDWELEVNLRMSLMNGYNHSGDYWIYYGGGYEQVGTVTAPATQSTGHPVDIYSCFDQTKWRSRDELQTVSLNDLGTFIFEKDINYDLVWSGLNLGDSYTLERPSYTAYKSKTGGSLGTGECFWSYTSKNWSSTLGQRVRIGTVNKGSWAADDINRQSPRHYESVSVNNYMVIFGGSLQCLLGV